MIVYGNLESENYQDHAQKPQQKLYVHEFGFWFNLTSLQIKISLIRLSLSKNFTWVERRPLGSRDREPTGAAHTAAPRHSVQAAN
jgi:hypothetical protein